MIWIGVIILIGYIGLIFLLQGDGDEDLPGGVK